MQAANPIVSIGQAGYRRTFDGRGDRLDVMAAGCGWSEPRATKPGVCCGCGQDCYTRCAACRQICHLNCTCSACASRAARGEPVFDPEGLAHDWQAPNERFNVAGMLCAVGLVLLGVLCWPVGAWLLSLLK